MATEWRTGMKPTKARLDDGSSTPWTTNTPIRAEQLRDRLDIGIKAGQEMAAARMNS
jgi:hypothetical protein